jgi:hypothetical protein
MQIRNDAYAGSPSPWTTAWHLESLSGGRSGGRHAADRQEPEQEVEQVFWAEANGRTRLRSRLNPARLLARISGRTTQRRA